MKSRTSRQFLYRLASRRSVRLLSIALASGGFLAASVTQAANYYWDGGTANIATTGDGASAGGTGNWNTAFTNWDVGSGVAHAVWTNSVTGNTAIFGGTAGTVSLTSSIMGLGMTINTVGYTIATGGNVLTLGTGGITTANTSGTTSVTNGTNGNVTLGAAQPWTVASGGTLSVTAPVVTGGFALTLANTGSASIGGIISGTGSLTKNNTGTLNLSGVNTYSGGTTINQGTVTVTQNTGLGTGALSVNNTNTTAAGTATILNLPTGTNFTVGSLSGSVSTTSVTGTNTVTINTASGYSFGITQTAVGTYAGVLAGSGTLSLASASTTAGVLTLSGTNTYSGGTVINGGTIALGNASALGSISGNLNMQSGSTSVPTLDITTFSPTVGVVTVGASGVIKSTGSTTASLTASAFNITSGTIISAVLAGSGTLTKTGSGALILQGANTYTGPTVMGNATVSSTSVTPTANNGTIELNGSGSIALSSGITIYGTLGGLTTPGNGSNSNLYLNNTTITSSAGAVDRIGNSATVTLNYGGELQDYGSSTAGVTLSETFGTLTLGSGLGVVTLSQGSAAGSSVTLAAGAFSRGSNFATGLIRGTNLGVIASSTFGRLTISDRTGLAQIGTSTSTTGAGGTTKNLTIVPYFLGATTIGTTPQNLGTNFVTYDTGGGLRRLGDNEQSLITAAATGDNVKAAGGANAVTGTNTFNSLLLNGGGTSATPATTATTVTGDGGSLTLTSGALANVALNTSANTASVGGFSSIIFGTTGSNEAVITNTNTNGALTINSPIDTFATGGALTKAGAGTLILGAGNLYTGQTTVNAGLLQIGAGNGGSLAATSGNVVLAGGTLAFGRSDTGLMVTNNISGFGSVTQSGTGMTTYSGTGTYAGGTFINAGVLSVTGDLPDAGAITVSGGTYNVASNDTVGAVALSSGNITSLSTATLAPTSLTLTNTAASSVLANIGGATGITFSGTATTTLGGANTFSGVSTLTSGTVLLSNAAALSPNSALTYNGTATLNLGSLSATVPSLVTGTTTTAFTGTATNGNLTVTGAVSFMPASTATTASKLDLSGLTSFTQNAPTSSFTVQSAAATGGGSTNQVVLSSGTNTITANAFNVGAGPATNIVIPTAQVDLGTTNVLNIDSANGITVGGYRNNGLLDFQSGLTNPSLTIRGINGGATSAGSFTVGLNNVGNGSNTGAVDLTGGTGNTGRVDAILTTLTVGSQNTSNVQNVAGTFTMALGTIDATTIQLAVDNFAMTNTSTQVLAGTFNQNAGTVLTQFLTFGRNTGNTGTASTFTSTYNLGSSNLTGVLSAATLGIGSGTIPSASRAMLNFNNGTIQNYDPALGQSGASANVGQTTAGNLTIGGLTGGGAGGNSTTMTINLASTGTHNFFAESGYSITENSSALITGSGGLTANGPGTVIFQGANTYTGATTVNRGIFDIGGSSANGSLSASSALVMGGGTLNYTRTGGTTQAVNGTTINSSQSFISSSSATLALGAINRNVGGTVEFNGPGTITTISGNGSGNILGGYATYGKYDWATVNNGNIGVYGGYTSSDYTPNWPGNVDGKDVTDDGNGFFDNGQGGTNSVTINSLRFNEGNADSTVNINGVNNLTIASGGILVTPNVGQKYARINGGGLTTSSGADLVIQQNNNGGGRLQIGSSILGVGGLTKAGPGQLELQTDSPYQGVTTVNGGTMQLSGGITGTSNVTLNNSGTLLLAANDRIADAATVTLNGGTLNLGSRSEGSAGTSGVGALTLTATSTLDFGPTGSSNLIQFAGLGTHTTGTLLQVLDWEGAPNNSNGTDRLLFAGTSTAFTSIYSQSEVSFNGASGYGVMDFGGYFEVFGGGTPVPEPATWAAGFLTLAAAGWKLRRRKASRAA